MRKNEVYQSMTESIEFDLSLMPRVVKDEFCKATLEAVQRYFADPEHQKEHEEWLKQRSKKKEVSKI